MYTYISRYKWTTHDPFPILYIDWNEFAWYVHAPWYQKNKFTLKWKWSSKEMKQGATLFCSSILVYRFQQYLTMKMRDQPKLPLSTIETRFYPSLPSTNKERSFLFHEQFFLFLDMFKAIITINRSRRLEWIQFQCNCIHVTHVTHVCSTLLNKERSKIVKMTLIWWSNG